ncbi:MAG: hypothetical protein GY937_15200 [bacterium]|nr:hypothetical protein [bacterium]
MAPPARHRRWIAPILILLLLLAGAVGWAQTRHGFQRFWLPLAARLVGGTWSAEDGRLGLGGSFEVDGLRFDVPDLANGEVATLRLEWSPLASLRQGVAVVETLSMAGANLELHESDSEAAADAEAQAPGGSSASLGWPQIAHARVDDVRIRIGSGPTGLLIGPITAEVDDLVVPASGALELLVPLARGGEDEGDRGRLTAALGFSPAEVDTGSGAFEGNLELSLDSHERSPIVLALRGEGGTAGESVELSAFELDLAAKGNRLFEVRGSGALWPEALLDANLAFGRVGLLARLLGVASPIAKVSGDVHVEGSLDELVIEPALEVDALRGEEDVPSPFSESLNIGGRMTWQRLEQTLLLAPLELAGASANGLGGLAVEGSLQPGRSADLAITAEGLDLLPWLRLATGVVGISQVHGRTSGSVAFRQDGSETLVETDLALDVRAPPADEGEASAGVPLRLKLESRQAAGSKGRLEGNATLGGPGVSDDKGTARMTWERESTDGGSQWRLRADIPDFDFTPLGTLWEGMTDEEEDPEGGTPISSAAADAPEEGRADLFDVDVSVGTVRFRDLPVGEGRARAQLGGESWEVRVEDLALAEGLVDLEAHGGPHGGGERIGWDLVVSDVDLAPLLAAASPDGEGQMSGRLSVISRAEGVAEPGQDVLTAPTGNVSFELSEGRASGLGVQQVLTQVAEIAQFAVIDYDEVEGEYPIENGRVLIDELRLDGAAVHLIATGEVGARDVDLVINPRLGPSLRAMVPGEMLGSVLGTANQLLALPIVVTVKGPVPGFEIQLEPAAPSVLQGSFSGVEELLTPEAPAQPPPSPPPGS